MEKMSLALVVLLAGLIVVFAVLILLTGLIKLYGVLISKFSGNGGNNDSGSKGDPKPKKEEKPMISAPKAAPTVRNAAAEPVSGEIPGEILAVIAAAVASLEGDSKYVVRSVKRSKPSRSAWGMAGMLENTRPF